MGKKNRITVWINGKKTNYEKTDHPDESYSISEFENEQAAAVEESDDDEVPTFIRRHPDEQQLTSRQRISRWKSVIMAAVSAVLIGSVLGLFMLNMFVDIDSRMSAQQPSVPFTADTENDNKNGAVDQADVGPVTVKAKHAYVLQAGKFDSAKNAETMATAFREEGFSPMIWKKGSYHFVLAGIANSEEQANQLATSFSERLLEVYVKKWDTSSFETKLTAEGENWYQAYEKQWSNSLISLSRQQPVSKENWQKVLNALPAGAENISALSDSLKTELQNFDDPTKWESQRLLLELWYQTQQALK